jgi:hypothetical protein
MQFNNRRIHRATLTAHEHARFPSFAKSYRRFAVPGFTSGPLGFSPTEDPGATEGGHRFLVTHVQSLTLPSRRIRWNRPRPFC